MTGLPRRNLFRVTSPAYLAAGAALLLAASAVPARAEVPPGPAKTLAEKMSRSVTGQNAWRHLEAISRATEANGGHRADGSPGYEASAQYVSRTLTAAGYQVKRQEFSFPDYDILAEKASVTAPEARTLKPIIARFSVSTPVGGLTAASGCPRASPPAARRTTTRERTSRARSCWWTSTTVSSRRSRSSRPRSARPPYS
ncbi:hypothetical protein ACFQ2B_05700 [Streptomyces stramineus]